MIFKAKSINTVDNAGKQVDGMKRPREPPTGGIKMDIGRILPTEAAAILNVSPQFVRVAMQNLYRRHVSDGKKKKDAVHPV